MAGSLHWRTCTLLLSSPGTRRDSQLFLTHLDDLRRRLGQFRKIHVMCDNARFHNCRALREYLARWQGRIELHLLPKYAPETNPIEGVWWHLHEAITRTHRCSALDELLREIYQWAAAAGTFYEQTRSSRTGYKLASYGYADVLELFRRFCSCCGKPRPRRGFCQGISPEGPACAARTAG